MRIYTDSTKTELLEYQTSSLQLQAGVEALDPEHAFFTAIPESEGGTGEVSQPSSFNLNIKTTIPMPAGTQISIEFPKRNLEAPTALRESYIVDSESLSCLAILNANRGLQCSAEIQSGDDAIDKITIINALPDGIDKHETITIQISSLYNPLSMTERDFFTSLAVASTKDGKIYSVEEGYTALAATKPTTISNVEITSSDHTVHEHVEFQVRFQADVEIEAGAFATVQFPHTNNEFDFDNQLQSMTTMGGMFGSKKDNVAFTVDGANMKIETKVGTTRRSPVSISTIIVDKIKNPPHVGTFGSFSIRVMDKNKNLIATVEEGIEYDAIAGIIQNVKMDVKNYTVSSTTRLIVEFQPLHEAAVDSQIVFYFESSDFEIPCPDVFDYNSDSLVSTMEVTCGGYTDENDLYWNTVTLKNPYRQDYTFNDAIIHRMTFPETVNPRSARDISGLRIKTLTSDGKVIDEYNSEVVHLTIVPAPFFASSVETDEQTTYTDAVFKFSIKMATEHLPGASMRIVLPPELALPGGGSISDSIVIVNVIDGFDLVNSRLEMTQEEDGSLVATLTGIVSLFMRSLGAGKEVIFEIQQLRTPLTTTSSGTFKVYSMDQDNRIMNFVETDLFVTMQRGIEIPNIKVSPESFVVGALTTHTFFFNSPVPLVATDQIMIVYPEQTFPPRVAPNCEGGEYLAKEQECLAIQNIVKVNGIQMFFQQSDIEVGDPLQLSIAGSQNPKTGRQTAAYKLYLLDQTGATKAEMSDEGKFEMKMMMQSPNPVAQFQFETTDYRQLALAAFELQWTSEMLYETDSYILLEINSAEIGPRDRQSIQDVNCSSNLQLKINCTFITEDKIEIRGIFAEEMLAGSDAFFMITNLFVDVVEPAITESWTFTIYTPDNFFVDQIAQGLNFEYKCSVPCETCSDQNPLQCTKCNTLTGKNILYNDFCWEQCPSGTYYDASKYTCLPCNKQCLECEKDNGNECISCNAFSAFPFLDGATCKAECPFGTYGNLTLAKCMPCESPCQSCKNGPRDCNTCDIKSKKPYYQEGLCQDKCDDGYTVPLGNSDFRCLQCNDNCGTCLGTLDHCTSCKAEGLTMLSPYDFTCHENCPDGITVDPQYPDHESKVCSLCDDICATCSNSPDICSSCKPGYFLNRYSCIKECSWIVRGGLTFTHVNNFETQICDRCKAPCKQCQENTDYCLTCEDGMSMHKYQCVEECPEKYTSRDGICVLTGFYCRFGYEMNPTGDACFLKAQICEGNDILNYDKTKCIPQPGFLFPFPLLIIAIVGTFGVIYDKKKHPQARFFPSMISLLSLLESIGLISLVALSSEYGIRPAYSLSAIALLFLYGLNFFSAIVYWKQLKQDSAFKYWEQDFENSTKAIVWSSLLGNFKIHRMFYSRLGNRKDFNAVFSDDLVFYRAIMFTSCVYIITGAVPIIIASIFGLVYIRFGYQVQMFCIELLIIELSLLILMSFELYKIRRHVLSKNYYKLDSKKKQGYKQFMVMAGVPGEPPFEKGGAAADPQAVSILQKLIHKINSRDAGFRDANNTIKEIQDLHNQEIRLKQRRRCESFGDLREYLDENDEFQQMIESDDDQGHNYISEPSSPRSKEMLLNTNFNSRMKELSKVYFMRDHYDNCYHEGRALHMFEFKNCKMISRTVQTNVLELLGVDDLMPQYSRNIEAIKKRNLLNQKIDEESVHEGEDIDEAANLISKGLVSNVLNNFEGFQEKKKRKRLPPARMRQLPKFEISDITGKFDIDEDGNFIIISNGKDNQGNPILQDQDGRRVNKRGYLISNDGQIILRNGQVVFRLDEIDEDDEIPAPFCYQKNKKSLGLNANMFGQNGLPNYDANAVVQEMEEEEDAIDKEYQKLRFPDDQIQVERSLGSDDDDYREAGVAPSKQIKRLIQDQPILYNPNDEDFITQLSKPMRAKPKESLLQHLNKPDEKEKTSRPIEPANDGGTSIDPDFLLNGNINEEETSFLNQFNQTLDQANNKQNMTQNQSIKSINNDDGLKVNLASRPLSGAIKKKHKRAKSKILRPDQQQVLLDYTIPPKKRDKEQEILDGIERFQDMLSRHPLKPKQQKSSNTLANKNLNKVYGKIKQQFTKQIQIPEKNEGYSGGLQTPQQFRTAQMNRFSQMGSQKSQSSIMGSPNHKTLPGQARIFPLAQNSKMKGIAQIYSQDLRSKGRSGTGTVSNYSLKTNPYMPRIGTQKSVAIGSGLAGSGGASDSEHELDEMRINEQLLEMKKNMGENRQYDALQSQTSSQGFIDTGEQEKNALINSSHNSKQVLGKARTNLMEGGYL